MSHLYAVIRDLGTALRKERARADAAEDALKVARSTREPIATTPTYAGNPKTGETK
jgi:hypothetical protein